MRRHVLHREAPSRYGMALRRHAQQCRGEAESSKVTVRLSSVTLRAGTAGPSAPQFWLGTVILSAAWVTNRSALPSNGDAKPRGVSCRCSREPGSRALVSRGFAGLGEGEALRRAVGHGQRCVSHSVVVVMRSTALSVEHRLEHGEVQRTVGSATIRTLWPRWSCVPQRSVWRSRVTVSHCDPSHCEVQVTHRQAWQRLSVDKPRTGNASQSELPVKSGPVKHAPPMVKLCDRSIALVKHSRVKHGDGEAGASAVTCGKGRVKPCIVWAM